MNQVILIGNLCSEPELRYAASTGKPVANFRLAVNRRFDKDNKADFFRVVVWGKQAEAVSKYLRKGSQCGVSGRIQIEQYTDRDGNTRYSTDIVANEVEFLTSNQITEDIVEDYSDDLPIVDDPDIPF